MTFAAASPPPGTPGWLVVASGVVLLLVSVFGTGFGKAVASAIRQARAGVATRESQAREQERVVTREDRELTLESLAGRLADVEDRLDETERRNTILWNHVGALETHIILGKGPETMPQRPVFSDDWMTQGRHRGGYPGVAST